MWACAAALFAAPLIAMQFTSEVNWTLGDFMVFGGMLLILCCGIEAAMRLPVDRKWRLIAAAIALMAFLIVWVELAVGISP